eukprot:TRINITY_DN30943_c0_g1_i1.p1 TRINITY_DN30943_c0_g1~~TRINITY_DN30943_c0_g1_i1.p1  ORF type:complete len:230 (-),score=28.54 TRINITY_DN30943_c0_g1_i1:166-855(-)
MLEVLDKFIFCTVLAGADVALEDISPTPFEGPFRLPGNCSAMADRHVQAQGIRMYTHPAKMDSWVSRALQSGSWYDDSWQGLCDVYKQAASGLQRVRPVFLDVGAHIGSFSVPMGCCLAQWQVAGRIVAVEALPGNVELLKANLLANALGHMSRVFSCAVGERTGEVALRLEPGNVGGSHARGSSASNATGGVVVPLRTLDSIYAEVGPPMSSVLVMKMDIEGFEGRAF